MHIILRLGQLNTQVRALFRQWVGHSMLGSEQPFRVFLLSGLVMVLGAIFAAGFHHPDEHYQLIAFAQLKLGQLRPAEMAWEYGAQMRPSLQAWVAVFVFRFLSLVGLSNPFYLAICLRLFSGALGWTGMWMLYRAFKLKFKGTQFDDWFLHLSFLLWFVVYDLLRFSSESWSGTFFIIGFAGFLLLGERRKAELLDWMGWTLLLGIGIALGLSFLFRFQACILIGGFLAWALLIKRVKWQVLVVIGLGIFLSISVGVVGDHCFYGGWPNTFWNYFEQNIVLHKAANFGVSPWYYYAEVFFNQGVPPLSLLVIVCIVVFCFREWKSPVTWVVLPFALVHCLIGHKEMRFMFPIAGFMPLILVGGVKIMMERSGDVGKRFWGGFMRLFIYGNGLLLVVVAFRPVMDRMGIYQAIYNATDKPARAIAVNCNPYNDNGLWQKFYAHENLELRYAPVMDSIHLGKSDEQKALFYLFDRGSLPAGCLNDNNLVIGGRKAHCIYSSFPPWVLQFNFNHWLDRSNAYWVFRLD